ncbi:MAG: hypothetical protein RLZZ175_2699 [Bacteroidota bacterium]|jgi:hypothetical protein
MQNKDFQIHIPKPCHADWDKMTPNEQGKFCSLCDKTVVDFTQMNEQEIKNYFILKTEERICGHFKASQVVVPKPRFHQFLINTYQAIENKVSFYLLRQPALFMLGGFMFLVGCESRRTKGEATVEGKSKISANDSLSTDSITYSRTTGTPMIHKDVELIPDKKSKENKCDSKGKIENIEKLINGNVKIKEDSVKNEKFINEQIILGEVGENVDTFMKRVPQKNRVFKKEE